MTDTSLRHDHDRIAMSTAASVLVTAGTGVLGAVVVVVVPRLAGWLLGLPWIPFEGPVRVLRALDGRLAWWLLALIGLVVGVVVGRLMVGQAVVVALDEREIVVTEGSERTRVARSQVHQALVEGNRLTLRDAADVDLLDTKTEGTSRALTDALGRHGWPVSR